MKFNTTGCDTARWNNTDKGDWYSSISTMFPYIDNNELTLTLVGGASSAVIERPYRMEENDNELLVSFNVPGVKPEDINVTVNDDSLVVEYSLRGNAKKHEYDVSRLYDMSAVRATLEYGVLQLHLPKKRVPPGQKIAIETKQ